ncbi:preprotein translocase subunit SecY [Nonomuraea sp. KC401]|uniref:Protein translocase subunit SecY n=1 Tax=Nonomuraea longispora TaxID=1848320 RepID=A0A4V2XJG5_9ACTN|nr:MULTISPECIES: preprotein translocase subunit SecY [Nonomuraea]NBE97121.1 preprotein translocase subunit SecY [Nonomuraea sp. K271]TDC02556.1 preprotein translocase subunit SecY [Nonomuraea longispora]TLF61042.1 preprotein translocase subunit SecY [Nonomuraea sp. KC401]
MLTAFTRAFRTPDLRKKLLFTLGIIALFRLGSVLPTPGVHVENLAACFDQARSGETGNIYGMVQLFSGGALLKLSVFALGIMPYITASIILQLLVVVIPRLEALKKEGQAGQTKITQYTRYLTIGLAVLQSTAFIALARTGQLFPNCQQDVLLDPDNIFGIVTMVVIMTAGTSVIMWLGELITDRGVGNGMSILIFTQIVAVFPSELANIFQANKFTFAIVMVVGVFMIAAVVFVEQGQRRIPVQYAKRMVGRRMYGGTSTYIPLKVNQAGIIPVIFASSLLYLPQLITSLFQTSDNVVIQWVSQNLATGDTPIYMATFFLLIVFFTYFYVSITFNPTEVADNMKKYGGFIPGIRPGRPTAEYLNFVLTRLTAPGALYLGLISMVPIVALAVAGASQNFPFGGTSILIMVGVGLDTVKQIESQLQQRNYEGFLR